MKHGYFLVSLMVVVSLGVVPLCVGATDVEGSICQDTLWDLAGSPYVVVDDVQVCAGVTLTIEN